MTKKQKENIIKLIRNSNYGYVGGKEIADKATDEEILELVKLNDEKAKIHNQILETTKRIQIKFLKLQNAFKSNS